MSSTVYFRSTVCDFCKATSISFRSGAATLFSFAIFSITSFALSIFLWETSHRKLSGIRLNQTKIIRIGNYFVEYFSQFHEFSVRINLRILPDCKHGIIKLFIVLNCIVRKHPFKYYMHMYNTVPNNNSYMSVPMWHFCTHLKCSFVKIYTCIYMNMIDHTGQCKNAT